jgi:hypothetical protein
MLLSVNEIVKRASEYDVPAEDVFLIDLNLSGVRYTEPFSRIRFGLNISEDATHFPLAKARNIRKFYLALPVMEDSPYSITGNRLHINGQFLGGVDAPTEDFCDSSYPRRNGTVMNLNPNARTSCSGCKFCYTAYQVPRDRKRLVDIDALREFLVNWMKQYGCIDLSHLIQVAVVTGCFPGEEYVIDFLKVAKTVFSEFDFRGEVFYFGSQLQSLDRLPELEIVKPFGYCFSLECFERRDYFLRDKKRAISVEQSKGILMKASDMGFRTNFSYVVGLEPLSILQENIRDYSSCINSFPIINTFQVHRHHQGLRCKTAENFEYYLEARKILEDSFRKASMRPRPWENYRSLWYLKFADEYLDDIRTP